MDLNTLDVAIGLIFVYLLMSLICTTINEWIASFLQWRGKTLRDGIGVLLSGDVRREGQVSKMVERIYRHPLIEALYKGDRLPSYIPARTFALALVENVARNGKQEGGEAEPLMDRFHQGLSEMGDSHLARSLRSLIRPDDGSKQTLDEALGQIERWFDDTMDRTRGWYQRRSQKISLLLAVAVTVTINADSLQIAHKLWTNRALREQVVAEAKACAEKAQGGSQTDYEYTDPDNPDPAPPVEQIRSACVDPQRSDELLGQVTGWETDGRKWNEMRKAATSGLETLWPWLGWLLWNHLAGWLITAIALTLGAQFWFERLKDFIKLRSAGTALLTGAAAAEKKPAAKS